MTLQYRFNAGTHTLENGLVVAMTQISPDSEMTICGMKTMHTPLELVGTVVAANGKERVIRWNRRTGRVMPVANDLSWLTRNFGTQANFNIKREHDDE